MVPQLAVLRNQLLWLFHLEIRVLLPSFAPTSLAEEPAPPPVDMLPTRVCTSVQRAIFRLQASRHPDTTRAQRVGHRPEFGRCRPKFARG